MRQQLGFNNHSPVRRAGEETMRAKLFVAASAAALFMATGAFAQATTSPNMTSQTNSANSASIDQIMGDHDSAGIHQDDAGVNSANRDAAVVIQGGAAFASGSIHNTASVDQSGAGQRALVLQSTTYGTAGNTATLSQSGKNGNAFAYQFGNGNSATVTQTGSGSTALGMANNRQGVSSAADTKKGVDYTVALRQKSVQSAQAGVNALAGIDGNNQLSDVQVVQDWAKNDTATVNQGGKNNRAFSVQAFENNSKSKITQSGTNSDAYVQQQAGYDYGNSGNSATIAQAGDVVGASISQIDSNGSIATINQHAGSSYSEANTYQTGAMNYASVDQYGNNLLSDLRQAGGSDSATVSQYGSYNVSSVQQNLANGWANVNQTGTNSTATITQGSVNSFHPIAH